MGGSPRQDVGSPAVVPPSSESILQLAKMRMAMESILLQQKQHETDLMQWTHNAPQELLLTNGMLSVTDTQQINHNNTKTLWMGDLAPFMDEAFLHALFAPTKQLISVKVIRNKLTGSSEGYAFIEMNTHEAADGLLQTYNGKIIPGSNNMVFRLNWAAYGVGRSSQPTTEDFSLFVGDVAPDVSGMFLLNWAAKSIVQSRERRERIALSPTPALTPPPPLCTYADFILQEYFRQFYASVRSAKVITDASTGRSKGYGGYFSVNRAPRLDAHSRFSLLASRSFARVREVFQRARAQRGPDGDERALSEQPSHPRVSGHGQEDLGGQPVAGLPVAARGALSSAAAPL